MPKRNLAWILVIVIITLLMWQMPQTIAGRDAVYTSFAPLVDARAQIRKRFVEEVNDEELSNAAVEAAIRAMVERLHDPHAIYLPQPDYERFKHRTEGLFGGLGIDVWSRPDGLEILSCDANTPGQAADLQPGDLITHVDGVSARGVPLVEAVNTMLNGPPDSEVVLRVRRATEGSDRTVTLVRALIHLEAVRGWSRAPGGEWRFMIDSARRLAYLRLTKFTADAAERLDEAMQRLFETGLRGLVLDLRDNTGGLFDVGREVADRFLEGGLIVRTSGLRSDEKSWYAMRDGTYPPFPVVVLINGATASAAEIVAGALRDHKRALVVGERSYGKGSVQEVVELDRGAGAIKLTTAYYFLPNGECIHRTVKALRRGTWGVAPNVEANMTEAQREAWSLAWRELSRDPIHTDSQPTLRRQAVVEAAAARLIAADPQLKTALDLLARQLSASTQPASRAAPDAS